MTPHMTEAHVEQAALDWLRELGYSVLHGGTIAPGEATAERDSYNDVVLKGRLRDAIYRHNPHLPEVAVEEALRKVVTPQSPALIVNNRAFHRMLVNGVEVEYMRDGRLVGDRVVLADWDNPDNNDWLAVNQFTVQEGVHNRRADVVVFLNGMPLAVLELKNAASDKADIWSAFNQLQTYKTQVPSLFTHNALLMISNGNEARVGTLTASREWFMPWRTIEGEEPAPVTLPQLQVVLQGLFERSRFLDYVRHFIVFEQDGPVIIKKMAGYHQFHAVNAAVNATLAASGSGGDKRIGVVWHTQGSGKSLTMAFFTGKVVLHPGMENPTVVVLTDRNDLDNQLFGNFALCSELLRQNPVQADSRADLLTLLKVQSGGVVFTTIQKFLSEDGSFPLLSERRNIVVMADEAHRSQYDFIDGFAYNIRQALPNASFIGFTGTPVELSDRNTQAVFGDYISVYDIEQAVADGSTVPIYYEARYAKLDLPEIELPVIDEEFEKETAEADDKRENLKSRWGRLEAVVGAQRRIDEIARDLVDHFETRTEALEGKAMVVAMSRRICVALYDAIVALRPEWHSERDEEGAIKIVMTGSAADDEIMTPHIRSKARRDELAKRFKKPEDPFRIVIVRDMWLTGFDAPCLHTMYLDKPMQGHGLMQAIARVNRVFKDKPGGLIVDYLGLADELKKALAAYTRGGGTGTPALDVEKAAAIMMEKHEVCRAMFHGFDYSRFFTGTATEKLQVLPEAQEHILSLHDGKDRFVDTVVALKKAHALAVSHANAKKIRGDVQFFEAVKIALTMSPTPPGVRTEAELDQAIRQIVSRAVLAEGVVDIFSAAGLQRPDVSILSEEFLEKVKEMPQRNLAVELLKKLLADEIKARGRKNRTQAKKFSEKLYDAVQKYESRFVSVTDIINLLVELSREMRDAADRGKALGLTEDELAFYDALEVNDSAVAVLGDAQLAKIARDLTETVRKNTTIDWTSRESVRANIRRLVKRVLRINGYPPDKQDSAVKTVIEQAETLCEDWVGE